VRAVIIIGLLAGCGPIPRNQIVEAPPHAIEAVQVVHDFLSYQLSYQLGGEPLPEFEGWILWVEGDCLEFDQNWLDDIFYPKYSDCLEGWYEDDTLWVLVRPSISDTTLSHELIHYWLEAVYGDSDGDHDEPLWWDLVQPANGAIKRMEQSSPDEPEGNQRPQQEHPEP